MKKLSFSKSGSGRIHQRGMTSFDLLLVVAGVWIAWSVVSGLVHRHLVGDWDEQRLEKVAARMVAMSRFARQAGVDLVTPGDLNATIERIAEGETVRSGIYAGQFYGIRELDELGRKRVKDYLKLEEGGLLSLASAEETERD